MRRCFPEVLLLLLLLLAPTRAWSQAAVRVQTNAPESRVLIDAADAGRASQRVFSIAPGPHTLTLLPDVPDAWALPPRDTTFTVTAGDTAYIELNFPYRYRIETIPPGAQAILAGDLLGTTPLLLTREAPVAEIQLAKAGYARYVLRPDSALWNPYLIRLEPLPAGEGAGPEVGLLREPSRTWINWVAGGVALAAGSVAVYYKFKADDLYERYEQTGNPALRPRIERYDLYSGVALGTMQVGVGLIAVRLLFDF